MFANSFYGLMTLYIRIDISRTNHFLILQIFQQFLLTPKQRQIFPSSDQTRPKIWEDLTVK